jgi:hypothetical protein
MFASDYLLAVLLLTAAPGSAEPGPAVSAKLYKALRQPVTDVAIQWEILDSREMRYMLVRQEDFVADLNLLRKRYHDLSHAPLVADCYRFPDRGTINELLTFNREYRRQIEPRQPLELVHWWELRLALQETDHLYQIWDTVRDARCDYYYITVRRQALKRLLELVGEEAYYNGNLPPCVPLWRFQQLD